MICNLERIQKNSWLPVFPRFVIVGIEALHRYLKDVFEVVRNLFCL